MHTGGRRGEREAEGVKKAKKYNGDEEERKRVMAEREREEGEGGGDSCGIKKYISNMK